MKRNLITTFLLCFILIVSSCDIIMQPATTPTQNAQTTEIPLETPASNITIAPTELTVQPQDTATPQSEPTPYNTMEFYSCYANMISYNPSNGWAEFDYFYILKGQEAIDYLVEHDGYSQIDAENMVNDFADGEYVCQNNNTSVRTIDLDTVPIKLMFYSDGTQVTDSISVNSTSSDVTSLFNLNPDYLYKYFFFYIHCDSDGNVTLVEQVYWC